MRIEVFKILAIWSVISLGAGIISNGNMLITTIFLIGYGLILILGSIDYFRSIRQS